MPDTHLPSTPIPSTPGGHSHVFLGEGHEHAERRTWSVIWLCGAMMIVEIVGGSLFGSIALVADGLHMSTHAGAMLLAALAYRYARRHANDARFAFGTGKLGDLAGFTSAVILAMIAILICYAAVTRLIAPVAIHFGEAIPIAVLGLAVNVACAWLLASGGHTHHGHGHGQGDHRAHVAHDLVDRGGYLQSRETIPEPHEFEALVRIDDQEHAVTFEEHAHRHGAADRDNNMRAAVLHVAADAAVSVLVIIGLILARAFGWLWMDPLAGVVGACVIASWSYGLIRDTGAILLDMSPDRDAADRVREAIESDGDRITDLHLWRLGPGHLGAILGVATDKDRDGRFYRARLERVRSLSHVTIEIERLA